MEIVRKIALLALHIREVDPTLGRDEVVAAIHSQLLEEQLRRGINPWISAGLDAVVSRLLACIPAGWLASPRMKYIELRLDMRTGSFLTRDQHGETLDREYFFHLLEEMEQRNDAVSNR